MSGISPVGSFMIYFGIHSSKIEQERKKQDSQMAKSALSDEKANEVRTTAIDNLIKQDVSPEKAEKMIDALW